MMLISRFGIFANLRRNSLWLAKARMMGSLFASGSSILWTSICSQSPELRMERSKFGTWGCLKSLSTAFCTILTKFVCLSGVQTQRISWPLALTTTIFTFGIKRNVGLSRLGQIMKMVLLSWFSLTCTTALSLKISSGFQIRKASSSAWCSHLLKRTCSSKSGKWIQSSGLKRSIACISLILLTKMSWSELIIKF